MSKRICVFGDSIAFGAYDNEGGGWVARLGKFYKTNFDDISVYNVSISGDNSDDLLERFDIEARAREPEIVIIAIGTNDSSFSNLLNENRVVNNKFKDNLNLLLKKANVFTKKVVFTGITLVDESKVAPIPWDENIFYKNESIKEYDGVIKSFCKKNNLLFIEMYDLLDKDDLDDGLHPNSVGHEKMFQRVKDFLIENRVI